MQNKIFIIGKEQITKEKLLSSFISAPMFQFTKYSKRSLQQAQIHEYADILEFVAVSYNLRLYRTPLGFVSANNAMTTAMNIILNSIKNN